jgi:hypothetical protein
LWVDGPRDGTPVLVVRSAPAEGKGVTATAAPSPLPRDGNQRTDPDPWIAVA